MEKEYTCTRCTDKNPLCPVCGGTGYWPNVVEAEFRSALLTSDGKLRKGYPRKLNTVPGFFKTRAYFVFCQCQVLLGKAWVTPTGVGDDPYKRVLLALAKAFVKDEPVDDMLRR